VSPSFFAAFWIPTVALVRMRRRSKDDPPPPATLVLPEDPPITDVIQAALKHTRTAPDVLLAYRSRARFRALLPKVVTSYQHWRWRGYDMLHDALYPTLPFRRLGWYGVPVNEFRVLFLWDLSDLVFNTDRYFSGRIYRINNELRNKIVLEVHQAYGRLRQLRVLLARVPRTEKRLRLHYRTRVEETTALLNFLTGNYLERWKGTGSVP